MWTPSRSRGSAPAGRRAKLSGHDPVCHGIADLPSPVPTTALSLGWA